MCLTRWTREVMYLTRKRYFKHRFWTVRVPPLNIFGGGSRPMRSLDSGLPTNHRPQFQTIFCLWLTVEAATLLRFSQSRANGNSPKPVKLQISSQVIVKWTWYPLNIHLTTTWLPLECHLTTTWLPLAFHLPTTWGPLDCQLTSTWLPLECHLTTTWLLLDYQLTSTWLPLDYHLTTTQQPLDIHSTSTKHPLDIHSTPLVL